MTFSVNFNLEVCLITLVHEATVLQILRKIFIHRHQGNRRQANIWVPQNSLIKQRHFVSNNVSLLSISKDYIDFFLFYFFKYYLQ